jgi:predicted amidohydrolase YtcJ
LDDVSGTIEPGKFADFALLDRNPFDAPIEHIHAARVRATWVEGEQVFSAN